MTAQEIEVIRTDITIAEKIFYANKNDTFMLNESAYHSGQAIEKSLKAFIKDRDINLYKLVSNVHSIESLLVKAEICEKGFIKNHEFLAANAEELSKFNALRYGIKHILKNETYQTLQAAKNLYREIEKQYIEEKGSAIEDRHSEAEKQIRNTERIQFYKKPMKPTAHKIRIDPEFERDDF